MINLSEMEKFIITGMVLLPMALIAAPAKHDREKEFQRQQRNQARIGVSLLRVARQLDLVIAEYDRNGLEGDDVDALKRFHVMLNSLSESDVQKITKQLQDARLIKTEQGKASENAFSAFSGQKKVLVKLNEIYLEWQQHQIFRELSDRFNLLATAQGNNMKRTRKLVNKYEGLPASRFGEAAKIDLRIRKALLCC